LASGALATLGAFTLIIHFNVAKITQTMKDNVMSMASSLFIHIHHTISAFEQYSK